MVLTEPHDRVRDDNLTSFCLLHTKEDQPPEGVSVGGYKVAQSSRKVLLEIEPRAFLWTAIFGVAELQEVLNHGIA